MITVFTIGETGIFDPPEADFCTDMIEYVGQEVEVLSMPTIAPDMPGGLAYYVRASNGNVLAVSPFALRKVKEADALTPVPWDAVPFWQQITKPRGAQR